MTSNDFHDAALEKLGHLRDCLERGADDQSLSSLVEQAEQLVRSVETFHMEAIRFRLFGLRRQLTKQTGTVPPEAAALLDEASQALEASGFLIK